MTMPIEYGEYRWMAGEIVQRFAREDANTRARVMALLIAARERWLRITTSAPPAPYDPSQPLTEPQYRELGRLARGPQCTSGKGRARVHDALVARGFARFVADVNGCEITSGGLYFYQVTLEERRRAARRGRGRHA